MNISVNMLLVKPLVTAEQNSTCYAISTRVEWTPPRDALSFTVVLTVRYSYVKPFMVPTHFIICQQCQINHHYTDHLTDLHQTLLKLYLKYSKTFPLLAYTNLNIQICIRVQSSQPTKFLNVSFSSFSSSRKSFRINRIRFDNLFNHTLFCLLRFSLIYSV